MNEHTFPNPALSPIQVPIKLLRIVIPIIIQLIDDHTNFVQEVPRDLNVSQCFWHFMSWKTYPNVRTFRFRNFEQSGSILHFYLRIGKYCVNCFSSQFGNLAITSIIVAAGIWDADQPCSVKAAKAPESSSTVSPRSTTLLSYVCNFVSQLRILEVTYVHQCGKVDFFLVSL